MNNFKLFNGKEIDDLKGYLRNYFFLYPDIQLFVGTDSAQHGKITKYATVITMVHPGKGAHVIFRRMNLRRERDMFTRLWNEVEFSKEVADFVQDSLNDVYEHDENKKIPTIHLDFNKSPRYRSYMVHDLSIGYLRGFGYEVFTKPDSWASSFCADMLVQN